MGKLLETEARKAHIDRIRQGVRLVAETCAETIWPTQCVICNKPGEVLCDSCLINLPYIDQSRACKTCGAPFGQVQCSECNLVSLANANRTKVPFDTCSSAVVYTASATKVIRSWKDAGEQRLGAYLGTIMANLITPLHNKPGNSLPVITYIPATKQAYLRRGFDHALQIAALISKQTTLPYATLFARPQSLDQRKFGRVERMENMAGRFSLTPNAQIPARVILIDDVMTSGATLYAASDLLRANGAEHITCITFARVW